MKYKFLLWNLCLGFSAFLLFFVSAPIHAQNLTMNIFHVGSRFGQVPPELRVDSSQIRSIYNMELEKGKSYSNLHSLCFDIGQRLSGTASAAKAVAWGLAHFKAMGLDSVYTQEVMVPHWERGAKEKGYIVVGSKKIRVPICALGGSVATPSAGLMAEIVEINHFEDMPALASKIAGKIVFLNRPFDQKFLVTSEAYGDAVPQRVFGAREAVKYGAIGVIIRSMSSTTDTFPHTGIMVYDSLGKKIPAAAISTVTADQLTSFLHSGAKVKFQFFQSCQILPKVKSYNVIGELKGAQFPNQVVLIGGHLDSWDLAQGAHDDGTGVVQSMEVLQLYKMMGLRPLRTIRAVLFMSEENGSAGGIQYAHLQTLKGTEHHVAAIESDDGGFTPRGFEITTSDALKSKFESWRPLFVAYSAAEFKYSGGGGGADIETLGNQSSALIGYNCDSQRYFDIHHTANDLFSQVNQRELKLGAASIASLVYLLDKYGL